MVNKFYRDGMVGVVLSKKGWVTVHNHPELLFSKVLVGWLDEREKLLETLSENSERVRALNDRIMTYVNEGVDWGFYWYWDPSDLFVEWVKEGDEFTVDNLMDGEVVVLKQDRTWWRA